MKTLSIIGARPQFIKIAPVCRAIERINGRGEQRIDDAIVHTGQHYDDAMSANFFDELHIPRPTVNLGVGSGSHGEQTGRMLMALERVMLDVRPDVVVVYGDTNSTLAGAIAAAKLGMPIAHVEAGLRSFNRAMPEEINRVVADHTADVLYAPTPTAVENLRNEGLGAKSVLSGDVMYDAVLFNRTLVHESTTLRALSLEPRGYALATIHRAENTAEPVLLDLFATLNEIAERHCPIVFPMHPRTKNVLRETANGLRRSGHLHVVEPVGYLENLFLIEHARLVLTDSGGIQKEAFFLRTPCITLRNETEWLETVAGGANQVVGVKRSKILKALEKVESRGAVRSATARGGPAGFGDGKASDMIVEHLMSFYMKHGKAA